jgi:hypothetical protein
MNVVLTLLLDYFAVNCGREKRNFLRFYLVLLGICVVLLGFNSHSRIFQEWLSAKHALSFIIAYSITLLFFVAGLTAALQLLFASLLAYSLALRRARTVSMSVSNWIRSEEYRSHKQDFLRAEAVNTTK